MKQNAVLIVYISKLIMSIGLSVRQPQLTYIDL